MVVWITTSQACVDLLCGRNGTFETEEGWLCNGFEICGHPESSRRQGLGGGLSQHSLRWLKPAIADEVMGNSSSVPNWEFA